MRQVKQVQPTLRESEIHHEHTKELRTISRILSLNPRITQLVYQDLKKESFETGRNGMTAEQVVKAAIIKQIHGFSYTRLHFHLLDSRSFSEFLGYGLFDDIPKRSTLADNIKKISFETWDAIHQILIQFALDQGIEKGRKIRTDATVVKSDIHHPTDASLLWDCVRVITRIMTNAHGYLPEKIVFNDHTLRAKRRYLGIINAKNPKARARRYKDLFKVTRKVIKTALRNFCILRDYLLENPLLLFYKKFRNMAEQFLHYHALATWALDQAERRILHGQSVPAVEKIVSIFESHADIIVKGKRDIQYGHKIYLSGSDSGLVVDCMIEEGNPSDAERFEKILSRFENRYHFMPQKMSLDGCFASKDNVKIAKQAGIEDIAFSKKRGLKLHEMVSSTWKYKCLRNFRAGIEGVISYLKRSFGLGKCTWKGFESFKSYTICSVITHNLLVLARYLM